MLSVAKIFGKNFTVVDVPKILTKVKRGEFSFIRKLGWKPKVTLEEGINQLIEWNKICPK